MDTSTPSKHETPVCPACKHPFEVALGAPGGPGPGPGVLMICMNCAQISVLEEVNEARFLLPLEFAELCNHPGWPAVENLKRQVERRLKYLKNVKEN